MTRTVSMSVVASLLFTAGAVWNIAAIRHLLARGYMHQPGIVWGPALIAASGAVVYSLLHPTDRQT
jgi:hypothetical protein